MCGLRDLSEQRQPQRAPLDQADPGNAVVALQAVDRRGADPIVAQQYIAEPEHENAVPDARWAGARRRVTHGRAVPGT